ncbi:MAG: hypothetical protein ABSC62_12295 [Terracidiphilus sp.]|jgi:hypothetical protein
MNSNPHNPIPSGPVPGSGEETLRLIAGLSAPAGLEDRVHAALRAAPRRGRVLAWPSNLRLKMVPESNWMRTAAAAAIVFVVVGGGWGVYTRVQPGQPAKVIAMPPRIPAAGGFSGAGAIRTPQTLPGPAAPQPANAGTAQPKGAKKPAARLKPSGSAGNQPASAARPVVQPATSR